MKSEQIISDEELKLAFLGTNFGTSNHRRLLHSSVIKKAVGYHCGYTITKIMEGMKLIGANEKVLARGRLFMQADPELYALLLKSG